MSFKFNDTGIIYLKKNILKNGFTGSSRFTFADGQLLEKVKKKKSEINNFDYKANSALQMSFDELLKSIDEFTEIKQTRPSFLQNYLDSQIVDNTAFWSEYLHKERRSFKVNKTKLRNKIIAFSKLSQSKKHLYFWTITFPEATPDEFCMKFFNTWLTRCRKMLGLMSYIWVCERQKNGTLHFHMLINVRMDIKKANNFMRSTLTTAYKSNNSVFKNYNPETYNGVDIDKNRKTRHVINFANGNNIYILRKYLTKYVSKNNEKYFHAPCHMSRDISALFTHITAESIDSEVIQSLLDKKIDYSFYSDFYEFHSFEEHLTEAEMKEMIEINELIFNTIT